MDEDQKIKEIEENLKNARSTLDRFKKDLGRISSLKDEVKLSATKNKKYVVELKKALKKMLDYKFRQSGNNEEALSFKDELFFYIDALEDDTLYEYLPLFDKVSFNNLQEERTILEKMDLPIYINRLTGDLVIVKNKDTEIALYSSMANEEINVAYDYFESNYLSLKEFVSKGTYVGDKVPRFKNDDGEGLEINFPYQEFIYHYDNLVLAFEHKEDEKDNFYFYPDTNLEITSSVNLSFEGIKPDPVAGLFKNQEYTYKTIVSNVKRKLENSKEVSSSIKR